MKIVTHLGDISLPLFRRGSVTGSPDNRPVIAQYSPRRDLTNQVFGQKTRKGEEKMLFYI